ncbi:hypothetical protein [Nocardia sp. NPDC127526]|uniref:hypothetical protein n=1 Tax=Nocardia sp. NPDC127526 TaxID=3345393 RepID=UPI00363AFDD1
MTNHIDPQDLGARITASATALTELVVDLALGATSFGTADFWVMSDKAEAAKAHVAQLFDALEIQLQGGGGPAADGFVPADPAAVAAAVREAALRKLVARLAFRDPVTGGLRIHGEHYLAA